MVRQLEAVYEHGILRPIQPLLLDENQHVLVTIRELPARNSAWLDLRSGNGFELMAQYIPGSGSHYMPVNSSATA